MLVGELLDTRFANVLIVGTDLLFVDQLLERGIRVTPNVAHRHAAILGFGAMKASPSWAKRFLIVLAAGLIAGESLVGVVLAIWKTVTGS